ncbi:MAG: starch-binding outer membrane protein SusE/F [Mucilaginibacter sp.]|nr:starch-binding outer membrane protein SusE/F [Mucilaginibacter sp.]
MKKILTKFIALSSIALFMLSACKKDGVQVTSNGGKPGALTASTTTPALDKTKLADTTKIINFTFTAPDYGFSAAVTNTLQIDSAGDNWANPKSVTLGTKIYKQGYSTADFNSLLLKLNLAAGVKSQVNVRIVHSVSASVTPVYSNVVTLTVTPFNLISYVYVPGSYQSTNSTLQWQPTTADSLVSPTGNGVYTGYVYFQAGSIFKITPAKNWNNAYGDAGGGKISLSAGGNLTAPSAGLYLLTANLNAGTITYTAYNHTWSLIGTAGVDWNTDIQLPFNQNNNAYQVTYALNSSGQFKFRADNAWTLNLGDVTPVTGQLTSNNGANINVPSNGNYVVSLSFGNPLLAPTYTLLKQ